MYQTGGKKELVPCKPDEMRNMFTKRCVKVSGALGRQYGLTPGKQIGEQEEFAKDVFFRPLAPPKKRVMTKPPSEAQLRAREKFAEMARARSAAAKAAKAVKTASPRSQQGGKRAYKPCPLGSVRNAITHRCVKSTSALGKQYGISDDQVREGSFFRPLAPPKKRVMTKPPSEAQLRAREKFAEMARARSAAAKATKAAKLARQRGGFFF